MIAGAVGVQATTKPIAGGDSSVESAAISSSGTTATDRRRRPVHARPAAASPALTIACSGRPPLHEGGAQMLALQPHLAELAVAAGVGQQAHAHQQRVVR